MCNLYWITTNQAAIAALFRVMNQYVGNLPPMPGVFPDYPAPVVRNAGQNTDGARELIMMRWGMPPPPRGASIPRHQHPQHLFAALARMAEAGTPLPGPGQQFCGVCAGAEPGDEKEGRGVVRAR